MRMRKTICIDYTEGSKEAKTLELTMQSMYVLVRNRISSDPNFNWDVCDSKVRDTEDLSTPNNQEK